MGGRVRRCGVAGCEFGVDAVVAVVVDMVAERVDTPDAADRRCRDCSVGDDGYWPVGIGVGVR